METKFGSDGADPPVLNVEVATDERLTHLGHDTAQLHDPASVAALANHLVKASGTQAGTVSEGLARKSR
jgi:hypothetical protein